ncbi:hypothetical protein BDV95DRAFT_602658 [Massariosphaeria phaeospora]|uniref:Nucleic acid-binding protein n=1 Tax=Massariosphaeria phaeospora TaxID=100035 RepID=A0A7C8IKS4_9PLEO|nr:hypothetical protein BDV95DRAFT_602658 [Massariosphaeria phaeospora]
MSKPVVPIVRKLMSSHKVGVVVSSGKMARAVKVRIAGQEWNKHFRKAFPSEKTYLVSDPNSSLREGDVVRIASGFRTSKQIRHVVTSIVAPFGPPVEDRPPVLTEDQLMEVKVKERLAKDVRSASNGRRTSLERLAQARKQGYQIPTLEEAMRNVRLQEEIEAAKEKGGAQSHRGQKGQVVTAKQRRAQASLKTKDERSAEKTVKKARVQTA